MKTSALRIFMFFAIPVLLGFGITDYSYAQGPGAGWTYYRDISLSPATPAANYQVKVTLSAGQYANMNANGNDLRFYDINDLNCSYWIELWNSTGSSIIWVKVASSNATFIRMYYGNTSAPTASDGSSTFDFFDDFTGTSLAANWQQNTNSGTVGVSAGVVTMTCNATSTSSAAYISSAYTPASTPFYVEAKHKEGAYNRIRYYASTTLFGPNPPGYDCGYFYNGSDAQSTAVIFWNGWQTPSLSNANNYLTAWRITDGAAYTWYTYLYPALTLVDSRSATVTSYVRYITIGATEVTGTSTAVDWVRVRKSAASEPVATPSTAVIQISAQTVSYSSTSFFIVPPCVTSLTVKVWGAGGGGAGTYTPGTDDGGGGGGGGGFRGGTLGVSPGGNISITVGTGGSGGGDDQAGGNGGSSSATYTSGSITANYGSGGTTGSGSGGVGGPGGGGSFTGTVNNQVIWNGGGGANGTNDNGGGGGGGAGDTQGGTAASGTTGGTGGSASGGNGGAGSTGDATGGSGSAYGGGGGGASDNGPSTGGSGANGLVTITWTYATPPTFTVAKTDITCFNADNGTITITVTGGTSPYDYRIKKDSGSWSSWTDFTIDGDNNVEVLGGKGPGDYTIEVRDNNGCVQANCSLIP